MEIGLSAITFYLASASSPVTVTAMDPEPMSRAEGEAVGASGAAAAATFRESTPQVGGAAEGGGGAEAGARRAQQRGDSSRPPAALLACPVFHRAGRPPDVRFGVPPLDIPACAQRHRKGRTPRHRRASLTKPSAVSAAAWGASARAIPRAIPASGLRARERRRGSERLSSA